MNQHLNGGRDSGDIVLIDRHVFASNASAFDTAWRTFGWTAGIAGERSGRLEEAVPWATLAARAEQPAHLRGAADEVLKPGNFDRLEFAFLPLDGRFGFSVWGAIGRAEGALEWRVLTHTLLFDRATFDLIAGFPFALLSDAKVGRWFREMVERSPFEQPETLAPVTVPIAPDTRTRFERARLREITRVRDRLLSLNGDASALEQRLAQIYEALALTQAGGPVRRVALRARRGIDQALLVRLAWLSLPIADRAEIFFTTGQRKTQSPSATLLVLPESEWGQFVPEATRLLERSAQPEDREVSAGRLHWARAVARNARALAAHSARVDTRGWRLIARDDVARLHALEGWRARTAKAGLTQAAVQELIGIECALAASTARARWRALGHTVGVAIRGSSEDPSPRARRALDALRVMPGERVEAALRAGVRALARGDARDRQAGAFLRVYAAEGVTPVTELMRLFDHERVLVAPLLDHPNGPLALFRAATALALAGHAAADLLAEIALVRMANPDEAMRETFAAQPSDPRAVRWAVTVVDAILRFGASGAKTIEALIDVANEPWLVQDDVLRRLTRALALSAEQDPAEAERAATLGSRLLHKVLASLNGNGLSGTQVDAVLRISWIELKHGSGKTSLERHGLENPHAAIPALVQLFTSSPPLPLFLRLRSMLLRMPATHFVDRPEVERWRPKLEQYCPALAARFSREGRSAQSHASLS